MSEPRFVPATSPSGNWVAGHAALVLNNERQRRRWSYAAMAERAGVEADWLRATLNNVDGCTSTIALEQLERLAAMVGTSLGALTASAERAWALAVDGAEAAASDTPAAECRRPRLRIVR